MRLTNRCKFPICMATSVCIKSDIGCISLALCVFSSISSLSVYNCDSAADHIRIQMSSIVFVSLYTCSNTSIISISYIYMELVKLDSTQRHRSSENPPPCESNTAKPSHGSLSSAIRTACRVFRLRDRNSEQQQIPQKKKHTQTGCVRCGIEQQQSHWTLLFCGSFIGSGILDHRFHRHVLLVWCKCCC